MGTWSLSYWTMREFPALFCIQCLAEAPLNRPLLNKDLKLVTTPAKWILEERPFQTAGTAHANALSWDGAYHGARRLVWLELSKDRV